MNIKDINPWWKTHQIKKAKLGSIKRELFSSLIKSLTKINKILCLYGPRRAGKTTLLYEMINDSDLVFEVVDSRFPELSRSSKVEI